MQLQNKKKSSVGKKALLKKLVKKQSLGVPGKDGASPFPLDNGLGSGPINPGENPSLTGGRGSNLGTSGVF